MLSFVRLHVVYISQSFNIVTRKVVSRWLARHSNEQPQATATNDKGADQTVRIDRCTFPSHRSIQQDSQDDAFYIIIIV